jgi:hypothetical protein
VLVLRLNLCSVDDTRSQKVLVTSSVWRGVGVRVVRTGWRNLRGALA